MVRYVRRQLAGLAALAVVVAASLLVSPDALLARLRAVAADPFVLAAALVPVYLLRPVFAWPTTFVAAVVGYAYGPVAGFPVALAGTTVSALVPFLAARRFGADAGLVGRVGDSGDRFFDATGDLRGMVVSRLAPAPSDAVSAAAGLTCVPVRAFVLGTAVGEIPWTVAAVVAGGSLERLSGAALGSVGWPLVAGAAAVAVLLASGPLYRAVTTN